jgi:hypothetical protein
MVVSTPTKLSLSRWAELMGINPLHFNQVNLPGVNIGCSDIWLQYQWQSADHIAREELAFAIAEAESKIENVLGYRLAPSWEVEEWHKTTPAFDRTLFNVHMGDIRGQRQTVKANWGYFISGGIQSKEVIEADSAITYSDVDSDDYFETAQISVITTVQDKNEICLFHPGKDGQDDFEIKPIEVVSLTGGTAVIRVRRELLVKDEFLHLFEIVPIDGYDDDFFLDTVDVYRRYNDPQTQVSFLWEPFAGGTCTSCSGSGCDVCAYSAQAGCLILRGDPRNSQVGYWPGEWDGTNFNFDTVPWAVGRQPDLVRLFYYSGWRNKTQRYVNRMDSQWERVVAYMACAYLDRPTCACIQAAVDYWRTDLLLATGDEDGKAIFSQPSGVLDNPFGSRRGEVNAWRKVRREAILSGVTTASV